MITISKLPWRLIRRLHQSIRRGHFRVEKPDTPGIVISSSDGDHAPIVERLTESLGRIHFETNRWAYYYEGEVLNLRRVTRDPDRVDGLEWWQLHLRGFPHPAGLEILPHYEPEPIAHPRAHLSDEYVSWPDGRDRMVSVLDRVGETYTDYSQPPTTD